LSSEIAGKRLFVGLLAGSLAVLIVFIAAIWYLSEHRMYTYQRTILGLGGMLALAILLLTALGVGGLVLILWKRKTFPFFHSITNIAINLLFPLTLQVGKLLGIKEDKIKDSFIEVNNQLVIMKKIRVRPGELLVLAPHCLQYNGCPYKITKDIHNCKQCGQCQVADFLKLKEEFAVNVAVVTGGTLARKYVKEFGPKTVIAIACERDLTSGILDSYPLPVYGILNDRPNGPCQDTRVELENVRSAVLRFIDRR